MMKIINLLKLMLKEQHDRIRNALAMAQARPPFKVQAKYLKILPAKIDECNTVCLATRPNFAESGHAQTASRRHRACRQSWRLIISSFSSSSLSSSFVISLFSPEALIQVHASAKPTSRSIVSSLPASSRDLMPSSKR